MSSAAGSTCARRFVTYTPPVLRDDVRAETTGPPIAEVEVRFVTAWPMSAATIQPRELHDLLDDHGR